jgi:hypothetical protein
MQTLPKEKHSSPGLSQAVTRLLLAFILYIALGLYLYSPYMHKLQPLDITIILSSVIGALGCFLISTRWIGDFPAEFLAGAIYGFCPFALGFSAYHPLATLPVAVMPWLFYPVVHYHARQKNTFFDTVITVFLAILPFILIIFFFMSTARSGSLRLFPIPVGFHFDSTIVAALMVPLSLEPHSFIAGLYHVPLAVSLCGLMIYIESHRFKILYIVIPALILAASKPVFEVPPVIWGLIVMLFGSMLAGLGMQSLALAGKNDAKWILITIFIMCAIAAFTLLLSEQMGLIYHQSARIHSLSVVLLGIIFLLAESQIRAKTFRWTLLCAAIGADILLGARFIINSLM